MNSTPKANWPDLSKDQRAFELAKTAMGWNDLTAAEQMGRSEELVTKTQTYKESL